MNKQEWKMFKKNCTKHVWESATTPWIYELFNDIPFINFLKKFKNGKKIFNNLQALRYMITRKPIMPCLEYVVTTKCTMNCKNCNTFIPHFTSETHCKPTSFEQFKKDIDTLLKSVDYIYVLGFVGGEPLIDKDLGKMIEYALSKKQIKHVFLATNCTILPSEKLLKIMRNKKFAVQISDYRHVENIKNGITVKYDEVKNLLIKNKIKFNNFQEKREATTWFSMPELYKDIQETAKVQRYYDQPCWGRFCTMICDGIITQCTLAVYITRNMELSDGIKKEIVDIRNQKNSKELSKKLVKFYTKPYSEFCHYCHFDNIQYGLPCGEQV